MAECMRRAHEAMSTMFPKPASMVAQAIWPDAEWRAAHGAGAAASRVLKLMEKACMARLIVTKHDWGWIRTGELRPTLTVTPSREPSGHYIIEG